MKNLIPFLLFFILSSPGLAQWNLKKKVDFPRAQLIEVDRKGDIYVADDRGKLSKFDSSGELLYDFSVALNQPIDYLDLNSQFKTYLYYQDFQEIVVLNRYLASPVKYQIRDYGLGFVSDVAPDTQQNIWLLDLNSLSLFQLDPMRNKIIEEKSLAKILDQGNANQLTLKSHHNRTYLIDQTTGIYVFDNLGNYLDHIQIKTENDICFFKDELYYRRGTQLAFYNLYTGQSREIDLPNQQAKKIRWTGSQLILLGSHGFSIYD